MVLVFDLNGTLLDTSALAPEFRAIFGRRVTVEQWFTTVLEHAMVTTLIDHHRDFEDIAVSVLKMMAHAEHIELIPAQVQRIRIAMQSVPAFPDVEPALKRLRKAGYRLAVLTNSSRMTLAHQLHNACIRQYFDQTFSVDSVGRYKPALEVYRFAAEALSAKPSDIIMVAAHHWDLQGAARAGFKTAFIERPGRTLLPGAMPPNHTARDLKDLAKQLIQGEETEKESHIPARAVGSLGIALGVAAAVLIPKLQRNDYQ